MNIKEIKFISIQLVYFIYFYIIKRTKDHNVILKKKSYI